MRLLDSSGGRCAFTRRLGRELLPRRLSSRSGTSHSTEVLQATERKDSVGAAEAMVGTSLAFALYRLTDDSGNSNDSIEATDSDAIPTPATRTFGDSKEQRRVRRQAPKTKRRHESGNPHPDSRGLAQ
jgi:hypothetical protein